MINTIKVDIDSLKNQIKDIEQTIKLKENELNNLQLKEEFNRHLYFYFNEPSHKRVKQIVDILEELFNIKFETKKKYFSIKKAEFFDMKNEYCFWKIEVSEKRLCTCFSGAYINENIKEMLNKIIDCLKQVNNDNEYIGVSGLNGLSVPEIENSGINFIKLD